MTGREKGREGRRFAIVMMGGAQSLQLVSCPRPQKSTLHRVNSIRLSRDCVRVGRGVDGREPFGRRRLAIIPKGEPEDAD